MYVYLLDYTEKELSFSSTDSTFLLSVIGIINTIGEVLIGWIGDQEWTNLNALYAACMLACGVATASVPFLTMYKALAVVAGNMTICLQISILGSDSTSASNILL